MPLTTVVFDLGGVMAEIHHTWQNAAANAAIECLNFPTASDTLGAFAGFEEYQAGEQTRPEYLERLSNFLGCGPTNALAIHNGILIREFPGIGELVRELKERDYQTGCLSNTNEAHWEILTASGLYPAIQSLDMKMASHIVGFSKPDPRIYQAFCQTFGLQPSNIIFFDDSQVNVDSAQASGWNARWIDSSVDTLAQIRHHLEALGVF